MERQNFTSIYQYLRTDNCFKSNRTNCVEKIAQKQFLNAPLNKKDLNIEQKIFKGRRSRVKIYNLVLLLLFWQKRSI